MKSLLLPLAFLLILSSKIQTLPLHDTEENDFLPVELEELHDLFATLEKERLLENLKKEAKMRSLLLAIAMNNEITEQKREEDEEENKELAREIEQLSALGRMVREENDEANLARQQRVAIFKRLMDDNITFPSVDEEALQEFIEKFHKTLPSKLKKLTRNRRSSRIGQFLSNADEGPYGLGKFNLA